MIQAAQSNSQHNNKQIEGIYDEAAAYYQQLRWFKTRLTRLEHTQTEEALLAQFRFSKAERYLEIGCGPGTWTKVVAPRCAEVFALDISANMIEQAKRYVGDAGHVTFIHGDAAQYQPREQIDGIFSFRVLEYVDGWRELLTRVAAQVPAGGQAVICTKTPFSVYRGTGRERWFTTGVRRAFGQAKRWVLRQKAPEQNLVFWQKYISPRQMQTVLENAGFTDFRVVPAIFGLPIFMRGTCQYPLIPAFAERPFMWAFLHGRRLAQSAPTWIRHLSLVFSESYVIRATKR